MTQKEFLKPLREIPKDRKEFLKTVQEIPEVEKVFPEVVKEFPNDATGAGNDVTRVLCATRQSAVVFTHRADLRQKDEHAHAVAVEQWHPERRATRGSMGHAPSSNQALDR
jgi:hypothetical protein